MADTFIDAIVSTLQDYSDDIENDLGWTCTAQSSPARREWDAVPAVIVSPSGKNNVKFIAFGKINIESSYDVFLVTQGSLANDFSQFSDTFQNACIELFMLVLPTSLSDLDAWRVKVKPKYDYDRSAFPKGYVVACSEIVVNHIIGGD